MVVSSETFTFAGKYGVVLLILQENTELSSINYKEEMIERFLQVTDAQEESVFLFGAR